MPPPRLDLISVLGICFVRYGQERTGEDWNTQSPTPAALMNHFLFQHPGVWFEPLDLTNQSWGPLPQMSEKCQRNKGGWPLWEFPPGREGSTGPRISQKAKFLSGSQTTGSRPLGVTHFWNSYTLKYSQWECHLVQTFWRASSSNCLTKVLKSPLHWPSVGICHQCVDKPTCTLCVLWIIITALWKPIAHNNYLTGVWKSLGYSGPDRQSRGKVKKKNGHKEAILIFVSPGMGN